jgi:hypothetical protein
MRTGREARAVLDAIERMAQAARSLAVQADTPSVRYGFVDRRRFLAKIDEARALLVMARAAVIAPVPVAAEPGWRAACADGLDRLDAALTLLAFQALIGFVHGLARREALPLGSRSLLERERLGLDSLMAQIERHRQVGRVAPAVVGQAAKLGGILDRLIAASSDLPDFDAPPTPAPETCRAPPRLMPAARG